MGTGSQKFAVIEPKFHVVIAVRGGEDFFSMIGIFSKGDDANAMLKEVEADCPQWRGASVQHMTTFSIKKMLIGPELGVLKKELSPLMQAIGSSCKIVSLNNDGVDLQRSVAIPDRFANFLREIANDDWEYGDGVSMSTDIMDTISWIEAHGGM